MEVYLARQPIFNRVKEIFGYELLFRDGLSNAFPDIDGDQASSNVLSNSFFCMGIDQITGGKKSFVNFTQELLLQKMPLLFPRENLIVEVLENVLPTEATILACREITTAGYQLALDDFIYDPALEPLIAMAGIIKVDIRLTPAEKAQDILNKLSAHSVKFLAEKVETYEEYEKYLEMGFDYFQGYFFSKPQVLKAQDISPSKISLLQIMAEVNREEMQFSTVETLISRDVSVSFKLLRYINSPYYSRGQEISSIRQAIMRLGEAGIRRFIPIILMSAFADNKPHELIRASVIRARFCELLCENTKTRLRSPELFTLGLFSLIDAIMDEQMDHLIDKLPFSADIRNALVSNTGEMADFLNLVRAYETGEWAAVSRIAETIGMDNDRIPMLYWDAVVWADTLTASA
ncbi:MAG: HDOD domain-containing protein [Deltaproteobacteria bacterium]|nr:HDOD domain-containing protein [Deltaproteobacteria bacterium]